MRRRRRLWGAGFAGMLAVAGVATTMVTSTVPAGATTTTVTNTADDGSGESLRGVLEYAGPGDVIELLPGATYELTLCVINPEVGSAIVINPGELTIFEPITINGNGATIVQTCEGWRVMHSTASLTLNDVTLTGGTSNQGGGGGLRLDPVLGSVDSGTDESLPQGKVLQLSINNSSIVGNCTTSNGGGLKMNVAGTVEITNSTIAGNQASSVGGGISHSHPGDVLMVNSTVTANSSYDHSGVDVRQGDFTAVYSDIVGNVSGVDSGDCGVGKSAVESDDDGDVVGATIEAANVYVNSEFEFVAFGTVVADPGEADNCATSTSSSGYNFADDDTCGFTTLGDRQGAGLDPMLGSLASNGGPTQTLLPQSGSPLIDGIPNADCVIGDVIAGFSVSTDQRGLARPEQTGGACDVGSVEVQAEIIALEPNFTG